MLKNSFFKIITFLFFVVLFNSCDKEFSVVGENIIGDNSFGIEKDEYPVVAYNQKLGPIQSNNMPINALGIYDNPAFGTTKANFVTQLSLATLNPSIDKETVKIKSVVLSIPYFVDNTQTVLNDDGSRTYVLDYIYGKPLAKMKLSVYGSEYYMRDLDNEDQFNSSQKYYTNQYSDFYAKKNDTLLNDSKTAAENELFFFDPKEIVSEPIVNGEKTTVRSVPAMMLNLNATFFENKILKAPTEVLSSNVLFQEYFRGLIFDIQKVGTDTNLALINFKEGKITVTYTQTVDKVEEEVALVINLTGHTANFLDQSNLNQNYVDATKPASDDDKANGVSNLYLKGGEGSLAVVKLFGEDKFGEDGVTGEKNGIADKLDIMRYNNYLINQAELTFYLNSSLMSSSYVPQRIYLYDLTNNVVLTDFYDRSINSSNTKKSKFVFGGIFDEGTDTDKIGSNYKFIITEYVRELLNDEDLKSIPDLGLVVTEDINLSYVFYNLRIVDGKQPFPFQAPMTSVMNPLGTIVYGNNILSSDANYDKKVKFKIYYTKAN
jgi:hypothetical protein